MKRNTWDYWINWEREDYVYGDYDALVDFLYNYDHLDLTPEQQTKFDFLCEILDEIYDNDLDLGYDGFSKWLTDEKVVNAIRSKEVGKCMHSILECNTMFKQYDKGEKDGNKLN